MYKFMGLALAAFLAVAFTASAEERREGKKEGEGKREEVLVVGKKVVLSDKAAEATFTATVVGRKGPVLTVKIEKVEGTTEWKAPKGETGHVKVGENLEIFATWEKSEEGKWRPSKVVGQVFERLRAGDKIEGGLFFDEHPRMAFVTLTARGEGEAKVGDGEKPKSGPRDGDKPKSGPGDGEKPKTGEGDKGSEF